LKTIAPALLLIFLFVDCAGCGPFRSREKERLQKQKNAADVFAAGSWRERRDSVLEIANYYGHGNNELVIGTLKIAARDSSAAVRREAVEGLAKIKTDDTLAAIKKIASDEKDSNVRWYAIKELRSWKDPTAAEIFIKGTGSDDWLIREESVRGILCLNDPTIRKKCIPAIIRAMKDSSSSVVLTALRNVKIRDPRLYQAIAEKFNSCSVFDYSLLEASLTALEGYRLDQKTKEKVVNLLVHHNTAIRLLALRVLKKEKTLPAQEE
jgi:HEAT repeat protein